ncbi:hypothetical protein PLICRDRAFT_610492 [Plicaturopsis crispa FD-325 SS-3]|nr:hypothetical protein PLICRDRAFT_610492 [Plicaturopsis crispa FD-325 SS-3]
MCVLRAECEVPTSLPTDQLPCRLNTKNFKMCIRGYPRIQFTITILSVPPLQYIDSAYTVLCLSAHVCVCSTRVCMCSTHVLSADVCMYLGMPTLVVFCICLLDVDFTMLCTLDSVVLSTRRSCRRATEWPNCARQRSPIA